MANAGEGNAGEGNAGEGRRTGSRAVSRFTIRAVREEQLILPKYSDLWHQMRTNAHKLTKCDLWDGALALADGALDSRQADAIVRTALDEGLEIDEIEAIERATKEPTTIGEIDISSMSKADRLFAYAVGAWVARVDGKQSDPDKVGDDEQAALTKLGEALRLPKKPREHVDALVVDVGLLEGRNSAAFYNLPKLRRTLKARLAKAQALRNAEQRQDDQPDGEAAGNKNAD